MNSQRFTVFAVLLLLVSAVKADGFVRSIVKAPITPDGNVAGAVTDLVINFNTSLDPNVIGRRLPEGCSIRVTLPEAFRWSGLMVQDALTPGCAPGGFMCTTGVFLQGWPQRPIVPVPSGYSLTADGSNTLVFTANQDIQAPHLLAAPGPGLKQIHLINGYTNPTRPGFYPVHVEFTPGDGCNPKYDVGHVQILPKIRPSINVTSAASTMGMSTIYQLAGTGEPAPLPWEFLLWDRNGSPLTDVTVEMVNPNFARLKQDKRTVGHIRLQTPAGASGQMVTGIASSNPNDPAPIKGVPAGRLAVRFTAGSAPGRYVASVRLHGGNTLRMVVEAF